MQIVITTEAQSDMLFTIRFYDNQSKGLGNIFKEEFYQAINIIQLYPQAWPHVTDNSQKFTLKKFPYLVLFVIDDNAIIITAIAHQHRHPQTYLKKR